MVTSTLFGLCIKQAHDTLLMGAQVLEAAGGVVDSELLDVTRGLLAEEPTPFPSRGTLRVALNEADDGPRHVALPYSGDTAGLIALAGPTGELLVVADDGGVNIFDVVRRRPMMVHHPYESFSNSIEEFLSQAAADPRVQSIKMTLYRAGGDSAIIRSLIRAAERGVQVAVLVELKARFDEATNVQWAKQLERAGVHVVYGMVGLKTHSKVVLVVRDDHDRLRRYVHIGTGNYNSKTARIYEDLE